MVDRLGPTHIGGVAVGPRGHAVFTPFFNHALTPAISIPCGVDHAGMPFGLQVIGRARGDVELLGAAHSMEQAFERTTGLQRPRPDLGKLTRPTPGLKSIVTHAPTRTEKG